MSYGGRWTREDYAALEAVECELCHTGWDPEHRMYENGEGKFIHKHCLDYAKEQEKMVRSIWMPGDGLRN